MYSRIRAALASPNRKKKIFDYFYADLLYALPVSARRRIFAGEAHFCPICDSHVRKFLNLHRAYHLYCPVCRSLQRFRFVWLFLASQHMQMGQKPERMLHIAPETALTARFLQVPDLDYLSADLYSPAAMVKMDVSSIQYPDASFDIIYCSHVLEHVPDDRQALKEFYRVLRPQGRLVLLVPILSPITIEDPSITSPEERERVYGQHDHVRSYGPDIEERVWQAGFETHIYTTSNLANPEQAECMALGYEEVIYYCQKD